MTIEQLHDLYLEFMIMVDEICKKNQVPYFLNSGTLLGAVRENDFISWDDDVDIQICSTDYLRFKEVMRKELPEPYRLVEFEEYGNTFFDFTLRIIREDILLRKVSPENDYYKNLQNHLCIDVFIMAPISPNFLIQRLTYLKFKILYGMSMGHRFKIDYSKHSGLEKVQVKVLSAIGKRISMQMLFQVQDKWNKRIKKNTKFYFITNGVVEEDFVLNAEWFEACEEGKIRNRKFPIPGGWDEVLTVFYGDYMTPVKMTERMHVDLIDI